ncbi:MAG: hypothetical protein R3F19_35500 [Verrucomicrobiales bacterium]
MFKPTLPVRILGFIVVCAISLHGTRGDDGYAIYRSSDRAATWTRSDGGLENQARTNAFAAQGDAVFAGTDKGILVSDDGGAKWRSAAPLPRTSQRVISIISHDGTLYAGTDGSGLFRSPDSGATWAKCESFPFPKIRCLLSAGERLFAGTDANGVMMSTDAGKTWTSLPELPEMAQVFALTHFKDRIFAALYNKGLYVWNEAQSNWKRVGTVKPLVLVSTDQSMIAGHNPGGLHWSRGIAGDFQHGDLAANGVEANSGEAESSWHDIPVWEAASGSGLVIAGAGSGIYFTTDQGRTWTRTQKGLPAESPGVAFLVGKEIILVSVPTSH